MTDDRPSGAPTYEMTAPAVPRPDQQSDTPAPGAADGTQTMQIDGRFAPMVQDVMEVEEEGGEPEPETGMDVEDLPVEG